jgi:hypothetical protein
MVHRILVLAALCVVLSAGCLNTVAMLTPLNFNSRKNALRYLVRDTALSSFGSIAGSRGSCSPVIATLLSIALPIMTVLPMNAVADLGPLITEKEVVVYFKGNPEFLKNPVLEAIRKIDQIDPDTEYQNVNKVILLVPIVEIEKDIRSVSKLIAADASSLLAANNILTNKKFDTAPFKKTFNRYSDNIYYSDPERANIYLGGGAVPNTQQTTQYLFRNSALTAIGDVKEDVKFLLDDINKKKEVDPQAVADAIDDCREALEALTSYLELADPIDVKEANAVVYGLNSVKK